MGFYRIFLKYDFGGNRKCNNKFFQYVCGEVYNRQMKEVF